MESQSKHKHGIDQEDNTSSDNIFTVIQAVFIEALEDPNFLVISLSLFVWLITIIIAAIYTTQDMFSIIIGSGIIILGMSLIGLLYLQKTMVDSDATLTIIIEDNHSGERLDNVNVYVDSVYKQTTVMGLVEFDDFSTNVFTVHVQKIGYQIHSQEYLITELKDPPKILIKLHQIEDPNLVRVLIQVRQTDSPNIYIKKARVRLNVESPKFYTDDDGRLQFDIRRNLLPIEITVDKNGYQQEQPLKIFEEDIKETFIDVFVDRLIGWVEPESNSMLPLSAVEPLRSAKKSGIWSRLVIATLIVGVILTSSVGYGLGLLVRAECSTDIDISSTIARSPQRVLEEYWRRVGENDFESAWQLLSEDYRWQNFACNLIEYEHGWTVDYNGITLLDVNIEAITPESTQLDATIRFAVVNGSQPDVIRIRTQGYEMIFDTARQVWLIDRASRSIDVTETYQQQ